MFSRRISGAFGAALALAASLAASNEAFAFDRIQPPEIAVAQRAGLAGSLANLAFGPADVSRGAFSLPLAIHLPDERGELLVPFAPSYNPDNGISPWGIGFGNQLAITRYRVTGSLAFDFDKGDELTSPFGRLVRGADGAWYPVGLEQKVRVVVQGSDLVAYLEDGTVWTFGGDTSSITSPRGIYAWYVRSARDVRGRTTTLTWAKDAANQPYLSQVSYGGTDGAQYHVDIAYEATATTTVEGVPLPRFVDYRSGAPVILDRRVKTVTVATKNNARGAYDERWHYGFSYAEDVIGAAFYLARVDRTFASGEQAPAITFGYALKGQNVASQPRTEVSQLTQLFTQLAVAADVVQPQKSGMLDADHDGNTDLEIADNDRTTVLQRGSGTDDDPLHFELSKLPPPGAACKTLNSVGCYDVRCRPMKLGGSDVLVPRLLASFDPLSDALSVTDFLYSAPADSTKITICDRDGTRRAITRAGSNWEPSDLTRLVDLDNDHRPDLIRIRAGAYDAVLDTSTGNGTATQYGWGAVTTGKLRDKNGAIFTPSAAWVSDVSGDGAPDLIGQTDGALEVWHGLGNLKFVQNAQEYRFRKSDGHYLTGLNAYKLVPADLNKDGLQDYFVTNADPNGDRFVLYFTNVGGELVETPITALTALPSSASSPVVGTFDASGDLGVTLTDSGKAYTVKLEGPGSGLLAWADDGYGTLATFEYARGPASPGIRHRCALLKSMKLRVSGYDEVDYSYGYASPTLHTLGRFLVGYDKVERSEGELPEAPLGSNTMSFLNGDAFSGLLTRGEQSDVRIPDLLKIETKTYDDASFQGIAFKRLARAEAGWETTDGTRRAVDATTYDAYESAFCPAKTTLVSATHGTLVTTTTRANPASLAGALHCLDADVVQVGTHADAALDFRTEQVADRNPFGRITRLRTLGASGDWVQQIIDYDADVDPVAITTPGKGTTRIAYEAVTKLPLQVTTPDGVVTDVAARDASTDALLAVRTDRGGAAWSAFARFDGQERLVATWNDVDGSSESLPRETYAYSYATFNHPATVASQKLVDEIDGIYRQSVELHSARDEKLATAELNETGWVVDGFAVRSLAHELDERLMVATLPATTAFDTVDYDGVLARPGVASPAVVQSRTKSTFGLDVATSDVVQTSVTKTTATTFAIGDGGTLARTTRVNGAFPTTTLIDPAGKLTVGFVDEAATAYGYVYDALGRLRVVALPDGTRHRVSYDEYGRQSAIVREGIAQVTNRYAAVAGGTSDLLAGRTFASSPRNGDAPANTRSLAIRYDDFGRKVAETHTDETTAATKSFAYFYDGATADSPMATSTRGLLTGVSGVGYSKKMAYRADGKAAHREVALDGFRTIATDFVYAADGTVRDQTVRVLDVAGNIVQSSAHHQDVDAYGRPHVTSVNGAALATTTYDPFGRAGSVAFTTGDSVAFAYDDATRELVGFDQARAGTAWSGLASTRVTKNERGFVDSETLGIGPTAVKRSYAYFPQGFLQSATDGALP